MTKRVSRSWEEPWLMICKDKSDMSIWPASRLIGNLTNYSKLIWDITSKEGMCSVFGALVTHGATTIRIDASSP